MMRFLLRLLFSVSVCVIIFATSLFSQTDRGTITGTVADASSAVIPGAQLTLTAADGKQFTTVTDANGEFTLLHVAPGVYTLSVTAEGFQPYDERALRLPWWLLE